MCWYHRPFHLIYEYEITETLKTKNGQKQKNLLIYINAFIMANTSAMYGSKLRIPTITQVVAGFIHSVLCLAAIYLIKFL